MRRVTEAVDHSDDDPDQRPLASLLGLHGRSLDVYRLIVSQPGWGVAEIAGDLGMTEPEVRACLDELAELSMLYSGGTAAAPVALPPGIALAALLHRRELEIQAQQTQLAAARALAAELAVTYSSNCGHRGNIGLERLDDVVAVRSRLAELATLAKHELLSFMPGGGQSEEALNASRPLDEHSLAAGVRIRTLYLDSVRNDRATMEYARWLSGLGGEIRTIPSLPVRLLIVDGTQALLPVDPENSRAGAVVVHAPGVLAALVSLFESHWERARPLGAVESAEAGAPTAQERELLRLLETGSTDEVAARRLGVSLRTVRRMMAEIMSKLGARSRFEAGLLAARCGWL
ncbi:helix-turn-helix transcriptional regulator [Streptomyces kanasensis]|uniref:helix-turn-helix transcriptional regulator n=1 Tax=Streptomyces kanasensis TaxID=936756 RepID=UPI0036F9C9F5